MCNAGVALFLNIPWQLLRQVWRDVLELNLLSLVTIPGYKIQRGAMVSDDGLGQIWQCNVFGHYIPCVFCLSPFNLPLSDAGRALQAKLAASQTRPGHALWMPSLAAHADAYDPDDWQLVDSSQPYEGTKFQVDLIHAEPSRRAGPSSPVRHFTVHPDVVYSSMDAALVGSFMSQLKVVVFYLVRLPLSFSLTNAPGSLISGPRVVFFVGHVVWFFTHGVAAAVHVCLVPLAFIPVFLSALGAPVAQDKGHEGLFLGRLHSITDRMGRNGVALELFYEWPENKKESALGGSVREIIPVFHHGRGKS
jgi:3-keto steroid reductase